MPRAILRVHRTIMFDDGTEWAEESTGYWPGHTAQQAYDTRAASLKSAKTDSDYDGRAQRIVTRHQRDGYVEIETRQFEEVPDAD